MLRASSLFYATVIALLIAFVSGSLILFAYLNKLHLQTYAIHERVQSNAFSGINYLLAREDQAAEQVIDLFGEGKDSVQLKKNYWGLFEVISSTAFQSNYAFSRTALAGYTFKDEAPALYLADQNRPLSLSGRTVIKGNASLPEAGVKRAYIEGKSFLGQQLIQGNITKSKPQLPPIDELLIEHNRSFFAIDIDLLGEDNQYQFAGLEDSILQPFSEPALILYDPGDIRITYEKLQGNIILISDRLVYIGRDAQIEDVLIYAPAVEIAEGFRGSVQLFATDSIKIHKKVILEYPSVACLLPEAAAKSAFISIDEGSEVTGIVFLYPEKYTVNEARITISKDASVHGQVYADGMVELRGSIYGNLTCKKLFLKTPSSVYENHLLDAVIDYSKLSEHFVTSNVLYGEEVRKIVKWLN